MRVLLPTVLLTISVLLASCTPEEPAGGALLDSTNATDVIRGAYAVGEARDTSKVPWLLTQPTDPRISHDAKFLGISVYQSKMTALRKISGYSPSHPITYRPDSAVVTFYRQWAVAKGFNLLEPAPQ